MNVKDLQIWLNDHGANPKLITDGVGGKKTREAIIQVFTNKNAKAATEQDLLDLSKQLGDTTTKRIKAVAKVETSGSSFDNSGLVKILFERHYFYKVVKKEIVFPDIKGSYVSFPKFGGYTIDADKDGINDSWEKLALAACINPDQAFQSISIGMFQVMGTYYKTLGYSHPIEMLWDASRSEASHYNMFGGYILKVANIQKQYLKISTNAEDNRAFCKAYNGSSYESNDYHNKLAKAMK